MEHARPTTPPERVWRDDRLLRAERRDGPPGAKLVLGLDLGTQLGFAYAWLTPGEPLDWSKVPVFVGRYDLSASEWETRAVQLVRLHRFLHAIDPDLICFEEVRNTPGRDKVTKFNIGAVMAAAATAAQFFGAMMGAVGLWAEARGVPCAAVPIAAVKKRATGRGNASKEDVAAACNEAFGTSFDVTRLDATGEHNAADAAWVLVCGAERHVDGLGG